MKFYNVKDINKFFEVVEKCNGKVELVSGDGDRLNLKSQLCKYVALTQLMSDSLVPELEVVAYEPDDVRILVDYMMGGKFE